MGTNPRLPRCPRSGSGPAGSPHPGSGRRRRSPVRGSRRQRLQPPRPAEPLLLVFSTCWLTSRYSEYCPGVVPAREGLPQLPWGCNDSAGGMPARGGEAGEKFGGRLARRPAGPMSGQGDTGAGRREEGMSRRESRARGGRWDGEGAATTPAVPRRARQAALLAQRPHSLPSLPLCILASFPPRGGSAVPRALPRPAAGHRQAGESREQKAGPEPEGSDLARGLLYPPGPPRQAGEAHGVRGAGWGGAGAFPSRPRPRRPPGSERGAERFTLGEGMWFRY